MDVQLDELGFLTYTVLGMPLAVSAADRVNRLFVPHVYAWLPLITMLAVGA